MPKDAEAGGAQAARAALLEHADVAERIGGVPAPPGQYGDDDDEEPEVAEAPAGVDVVWVE